MTLFFQQVINFDMPKSAVGYVHRIGRTGRAYDTGESVSLVSLFLFSLVKKGEIYTTAWS